jgi:hypothetical protein
MKLLNSQICEPSLSNFGEEACRLFIARDFQGLADRFGYALAYDRDLAAAIEADFDHCLSGHSGARSEQASIVESVRVRNFQPNDTGLLAVVECILLVHKGARVLVELIAAKNGENVHLYLEDINVVA